MRLKMKINNKVYLLDSTRGSYVYLIIDKETTLIDTGLSWMGKSILNDLEKLNIKPTDIKNILLTHNDLDHIGNAAMLQKLTGAKLWASKDDIPYIIGEKHRPGFKKYLPYIFRVKKPEYVAAYKTDEKIAGIEIIPTPGHTPGHVCLLFEDVLFTGDLVENRKGKLIPYPSGWNWNTSLLLDSIKTVSKYSFQWVCPAHGKPLEKSCITDIL
jgi:glyoxylase-like metal-dependent hydrolase (beta-lactamase superfamily II)